MTWQGTKLSYWFGFPFVHTWGEPGNDVTQYLRNLSRVSGQRLDVSNSWKDCTHGFWSTVLLYHVDQTFHATIQYDTNALRLTAQDWQNTTSSQAGHTLMTHAPHIHSIEGSCLCSRRTLMYCLSLMSHNVWSTCVAVPCRNWNLFRCVFWSHHIASHRITSLPSKRRIAELPLKAGLKGTL